MKLLMLHLSDEPINALQELRPLGGNRYIFAPSYYYYGVSVPCAV